MSALTRTELIVDALDELIVSMDPTGCIRSCNAAAARALGVTKDRVIGRTLSEAGFVPVDAAGTPIPIDQTPALQAHRTGEPQRTPAIGLRRPDGTILWVRLLVTLLPGKDEVMLVATDVTDEVERERVLETSNAVLEARVARRTAELGTALEELESFNYSVSHDLGSLIKSVGVNAELAEIAIEGSHAVEAREALARVADAAQRMADLTAGLLALAGATRTRLARQPVDLAELARSELARLALNEPGREVRTVVPASMVAYGDRHLLTVVVQNLLENAWKFTADVADPSIEVGEALMDAGRVFFVRDNGVGFNDQHPDLFRPFRRLHDGAYPGTGIGLATVQRIITRHGGHIWPESRPGQGCTFYFTLPEADETRV